MRIKGEVGIPVAWFAAGGHFDPGNPEMHPGPRRDGLLGGLPPNYIGRPEILSTVLALRYKLSDQETGSLMIHAGRDNFAC